MAEENIDYYHNNDYQTGHQMGILDAVNGRPYEDMAPKGYFYATGYEEGWKWAKSQFVQLDMDNEKG